MIYFHDTSRPDQLDLSITPTSPPGRVIGTIAFIPGGVPLFCSGPETNAFEADELEQVIARMRQGR